MLNLLFDDTEDSEDYSVASTPNKCKEESSNRTKTDDTFPKNNKTNLENVNQRDRRNELQTQKTKHY